MKNFENLVEATLKLLSFNTVEAKSETGAPFGIGNKEALDYTLEIAKNMGFETKNLDGYCGFAETKLGDDSDTFGILGHLDTVPFGENWTKNPLGEIVDGVIYGRGVLDDKAPILACLFAVDELQSEFKPKRKIRLIFGSNEESGWGCIEHYNKFEKMPREGFSPDADFPVINEEKGIVNYDLIFEKPNGFSISAGERANVVPSSCHAQFGAKTFETKGKSAHGACCFEGENAVVKMFDILKNECEFAKKMSESFESCFGENIGFQHFENLDEKLTINLGVAKTTDTKIVLTVDIRYPRFYNENEVFNILKQHFSDAEIKKTHCHLPLFVDKNDELVQTLLSCYNKIENDNATPITIGGGTYARAMQHAVSFGPVFPNRPLPIHCPDERLPLEDFKQIYKIYLEAIKKLCF